MDVCAELNAIVERSSSDPLPAGWRDVGEAAGAATFGGVIEAIRKMGARSDATLRVLAALDDGEAALVVAAALLPLLCARSRHRGDVAEVIAELTLVVCAGEPVTSSRRVASVWIDRACDRARGRGRRRTRGREWSAPAEWLDALPAQADGEQQAVDRAAIAEYRSRLGRRADGGRLLASWDHVARQAAADRLTDLPEPERKRLRYHIERVRKVVGAGRAA